MTKFAVIWDLDGTIIDSAQCYWIAFKKLFEKYQLPYSLTEEEYRTVYFGMTLKEIMNRLSGGKLEPEKIDSLVEPYFDISGELAKEGCISPIPTVENVLQELKAKSIPMAIGSSSSLNMIITALNTTGYLGYFSNIISGSLLPSKPAPDTFLVAAKSLNHEPQNCIVIEDSVAGIHSANNAGMKCIGITTTRNAAEIQDADLIIDSFSQLTFDHFEALLKA